MSEGVGACWRSVRTVGGEVEGVGLGLMLGEVVQISLGLELEADARGQFVGDDIPHLYHAWERYRKRFSLGLSAKFRLAFSVGDDIPHLYHACMYACVCMQVASK